MYRLREVRLSVPSLRMKAKRSHKTPLPTHLVLKVSAEAPADPRTVRKLLRGEYVSPMPRERIVRALKERGLEHLVPQPTSAAVAT